MCTYASALHVCMTTNRRVGRRLRQFIDLWYDNVHNTANSHEQETVKSLSCLGIRGQALLLGFLLYIDYYLARTALVARPNDCGESADRQIFSLSL